MQLKTAAFVASFISQLAIVGACFATYVLKAIDFLSKTIQWTATKKSIKDHNENERPAVMRNVTGKGNNFLVQPRQYEPTNRVCTDHLSHNGLLPYSGTAFFRQQDLFKELKEVQNTTITDWTQTTDIEKRQISVKEP